MLDFLRITGNPVKKGVIEISASYHIKPSNDLMIKGGDFYAIWVEDTKLWSTKEEDALFLIDRELKRFAEEHAKEYEGYVVKIRYLQDSRSKAIVEWRNFVQQYMRDNFRQLDEKPTFLNTETTKEDYASRKLPYPLMEGSIENYVEMISPLYSPEERHKFEWVIGAIVTGASKHIQKFLVLYGAPGTGKGTIIDIITDLFDGYYCTFEAKSLGSNSNSFALEQFKSNPLVAIQHDGDLSRIEDNTRLNSIVSHEYMTVNEKFKSAYTSRFNCFLIMGTNKPVKITDAKSGILRRLIDVTPTGTKIPKKKYDILKGRIKFELGAIASHCAKVFLSDPTYYDTYRPLSMMGASNDFYNYMLEMYEDFLKHDGTVLNDAWKKYEEYCDDAKVPYPLSKRSFKEELKNYFDTFEDRAYLASGGRIRNKYSGFQTSKFETKKKESTEEIEEKSWIELIDATTSQFDILCDDCVAQYATDDEKPTMPWAKVKSTLSEISPTTLHYVKVPENHIVIDFDLKDENGEKSLERNIAEASKWPKTYMEVSKSGKGLHLHYIYKGGDPKDLSNLYSKNIEVKVFTGGQSLRRKLTKCNQIAIMDIFSNLPLKKEKRVTLLNKKEVKSERGLRNLVLKAMNEKIGGGTKTAIDFIYKILEEYYSSGKSYDISDLRPTVIAFASRSSHHKDYCSRLAMNMKWMSYQEPLPEKADTDKKLVIFDIEIYPNLFLVCWKYLGDNEPVTKWFNPSVMQVNWLLEQRLAGYNNRRYDNHIIYAASLGYSNQRLYEVSKRIINGSPNAFFGQAYNVSEYDIYDVVVKKQSLKKYEIEYHIPHKEMDLNWDEPAPEDKWNEIGEYCANDVLATEQVYKRNAGDFLARNILADIAGMTTNDTNNSLSARFIFGDDRTPWEHFNYRNLAEPCDDKPHFEGYTFEYGKSHYRGEDIGEGGYVYAEPGMYVGRIVTFDVASMHPSSIIAENLFGDEYTKRFKEILDARIAIKHGDFDKAKQMLDGKLAKYLDNPEMAKPLANALKIVINSVYGLTSAKFQNPFKDPRNEDNIVAKRGELFMINLKHEIQDRGFTVVHIKTDSIKILNPTDEIYDFVMSYGKQYGYNFEIEHIFEKICLVNDAVYIAKLAEEDPDWSKEAKKCTESGSPVPTRWTATGTQFQQPYVFKTLFSKEPLDFYDLCETKSVKSCMYLDMNEQYPSDEEYAKALEQIEKAIRKEAKESGILVSELELPEATKTKINYLKSKIAECHNYIFVGKVGNFCPMVSGINAGELVRTQNDKYYAVTGTKGYRWLESNIVVANHLEDYIDKSYYDHLVQEAIIDISEYGDFNIFAS